MLAAALLLAEGCALPSAGAPTSYAIALSPDFTADERIAIGSAAAAWMAALPELSLTLAQGARDCAGALPSATLCIARGAAPPSPNVLGATFPAGDFRGDAARITLYPGTVAADGVPLELTALHELGHGMGLVHRAPGTVMAPDENNQANAPTPDDLAQWRALR